MKIGIILAMEEELNAILKEIKTYQEKSLKNIKFIETTLNNNKIILALSGVGKVNSARCTQVLIDLYNPDIIINSGVSGACTSEINLLDVIVADKIYQHDFDITAFNHNLGYVPLIGDYSTPNEELINDFINKTKEIYNIKKGSIAAGDKFINTKNEKEDIYIKFNALCCDMESASIAQVAKLNDIKYLTIRVISDALTNESNKEYEDYLTKACQISAEVVINYLEQI